MSDNMSSVAPIIEETGERKSIFRSKALRSYADRDQQPASYTPVTPRSLYSLWTLLAVVVLLGVITWLSKIPLYTPAVAVILGAHASRDLSTAAGTIVVFVPADQLNKLRVGQDVVFKLNEAHRRVIARIIAVEPEVMSPQAAQKRFDPGIRFSSISEPKAVALARLVSAESSAWLLDYSGGSIDAWVQTDSKPVLSLFPLRGRVLTPLDDREANGSTTCSGLARVSQAGGDEFLERNPLRALSCLLREKSLQVKNQKQKEGGSLYV